MRVGFEIRKREACEGKGVCKENERNTWGGKDSIGKITGGNKNRKEAVKYKIGDKMFYIRKCGRVGVTGVNGSSPSGKFE